MTVAYYVAAAVAMICAVVAYVWGPEGGALPMVLAMAGGGALGGATMQKHGEARRERERGDRLLEETRTLRRR